MTTPEEPRKTVFSFNERGFDFDAVDIGGGDALITIRRGNETVRELKFPAYKVYNIAAHANDIVDGLLEESDRGLQIAGSDGLGGEMTPPDDLTPETLPIWDEAHEKTAQALVQLAEMNESFGEAYKAWRYIDKIDSHWHIAQLLLWRKLDLDAQKADRARIEALERKHRGFRAEIETYRVVLAAIRDGVPDAQESARNGLHFGEEAALRGEEER